MSIESFLRAGCRLILEALSESAASFILFNIELIESSASPIKHESDFFPFIRFCRASSFLFCIIISKSETFLIGLNIGTAFLTLLFLTRKNPKIDQKHIVLKMNFRPKKYSAKNLAGNWRGVVKNTSPYINQL